MRQVFAVFICLYFLLASWSHAETGQQPMPIASNGETVIVAKSSRINVQVKIGVHEVSIGEPSEGRPDIIRTSCTYSRYPCSIVDYIDIVINGNPVFVSRSVFCNLADLNTAQIKIGKKKSILTLTGGDASESYIVKIEFDAKRVKYRSLAPSDTPNEPLQETIYHLRVLGD